MRNWVWACAFGEAMGIAGIATAYAAVDRGLAAATPAILAAGVWEGLFLGGFQAQVLRRLKVPPIRWTAATLAMAVLGYAGSLAGGFGGAEDIATVEPPVWLVVAGGAGLGLGLGALMGAAQALASSGHIAVGRWTLANAAGWVPAMALIMLAASLAPTAVPLWKITLLGLCTGAAAGLCIGLATRLALPDAVAGSR